MISIILTDDNQPDTILSGETRADVLRQAYDALARRNHGDCSAAINEGYVSAPEAAYSHDISLELDPEDFWHACVSRMLADSQDWHYAD
jgi:hypothetical protein